jgi:hypothetical protein
VKGLLAAVIAAAFVLGCTIDRPALEFTPTDLQPAQVGQPYLAAISVERNETPVGDMWVSSGELPPGLELRFTDGTDTGEITGTPTASGSYTFSVEVWCFGTNVNGQTGSASYTLTVN